MNIIFTENAWEDYIFWQQNDKVTLKKINFILKDIIRSPFSGLGKPEALKFDLSGYWSRRIDKEHRLVYKYDNGEITILSCRFHY